MKLSKWMSLIFFFLYEKTGNFIQTNPHISTLSLGPIHTSMACFLGKADNCSQMLQQPETNKQNVPLFMIKKGYAISKFIRNN